MPPGQLSYPPFRLGGWAATRPAEPATLDLTDPFSDMLRCVRCRGGIFLDARFTAPWCVTGQISAEDCGRLARLHAPAHIIAYHYVLAGRLVATVAGEPAVEATAGDIVLLPRNDMHRLASTAGLPAAGVRDLIGPGGGRGLPRIAHGGGGAETHIICGLVALDDADHPLIATLPRLSAIDLRRARGWIEASVRYAAGELACGGEGAATIGARISELVFVEAVRRHAERTGLAGAGRRGIDDPQIIRALAAIHRSIRAPWSATSLAREAALSRSAFTDRFTTLVGTPPIRYLMLRRLQAAQQSLRDSPKSVAQIADAVGYASEEAFSRAFKREFGLAPAHWRERNTERQKPAA